MNRFFLKALVLAVVIVMMSVVMGGCSDESAEQTDGTATPTGAATTPTVLVPTTPRPTRVNTPVEESSPFPGKWSVESSSLKFTEIEFYTDGSAIVTPGPITLSFEVIDNTLTLTSDMLHEEGTFVFGDNSFTYTTDDGVSTFTKIG